MYSLLYLFAFIKCFYFEKKVLRMLGSSEITSLKVGQALLAGLHTYHSVYTRAAFHELGHWPTVIFPPRHIVFANIRDFPCKLQRQQSESVRAVFPTPPAKVVNKHVCVVMHEVMELWCNGPIKMQRCNFIWCKLHF